MRKSVTLAVSVSVALLSMAQACGGDDNAASPESTPPDGGTSSGDATVGADGDKPGSDAAPPDDASQDVILGEAAADASIANPCGLPGSLQFTAGGMVLIPGGSGPDLTWLRLPTGFCAHYFGNVGNARQLRFAPGGELFVASPTTGTTGGGPNGKAGIIVLPDDDKDGLADAPIAFAGGGSSTQGLLFANGYFYYQTRTQIQRVPYKAGDRAPSAAAELVADINYYESITHWPKTLDQADDGTIFVGNGGDQSESCDPGRPFHGGILKLDGTPGGAQVTKGFRNPINVRCAKGHNLCFALELAKDYTAMEGGREKMVPIRQGDDWGFPCCATKNLPYQGLSPVPDCSATASDTNSFFIGDTPFGVDFEPGDWPGTFKGNAFVVTHGAAGSWTGARLIAIAMDPSTGLPQPSSNAGGMNTGSMVNFGTGWDDGSRAHGRPSAVTFSADGRLFIANDQNGDIFWIAAISP